MYHGILRLLVTALALILATYLIPGIEVSGVYTAIIAALFLGAMNAFVRPVLILLTLPITILSLGAFILVLNTLLFMFVASFIKGFEVDGFWVAFLGSIFVSIVSGVVNKFLD